MSKQIGIYRAQGEQKNIADRFEDLGGNAIVYSYPNGDYDIVCAAERSFAPSGWETTFSGEKPPVSRGAKREKGKKAEGDDALRSMRRARAKLRRLALANEFEFFVTLTFSPEEVDRYDAKAIMAKVNRWLDNMVRRHSLRYILVPEQHKDGAWHFHGFFGGDVQILDSGVRWEGREVYNLPQWGFGFTTAQRLYGEYTAAVAYVCKYIGKQQGQRPMGRWYYSGGDLKEPRKEYANLDYREVERTFEGECIEFEIPGTKMVVVHYRERGDGNGREVQPVLQQSGAADRAGLEDPAKADAGVHGAADALQSWQMAGIPGMGSERVLDGSQRHTDGHDGNVMDERTTEMV